MMSAILRSKYRTALLLLLSIYQGLVEAVSPVSIKGTKLYDESGAQFFLKGTVYVGGDNRNDPLLDTAQCKIDAEHIKNVGGNAVYIYSIDVGKLGQHHGCMEEFDKNGIYVWLQLGQFPMVLSKTDTTPKWDLSLYTSWTSIIDSFSEFDNLLAFGIGQETVNGTSVTTLVAPSLKAAARDLKLFRDKRGYRPIPISYSAGDFEQYRLLTAQYLTCGPTESTVDLYGINIFNNCSDSKLDRLRSEFSNHHTPVVFSEDGCFPLEREFSEVQTFFGESEFSRIFSGMNIYQWGRNEDGFALVVYNDETDRNVGQPGAFLPAYTSLQQVWSETVPQSTSRDAYTYSSTQLPCPTSNPQVGWLVDGAVALPMISGLDINTVTARTRRARPTTSTSTTASPTQSGTNLGAEQPPANSGMSTGALAGIVIAIVVVLLGAAVVAFGFWRRRKSRQEWPEDHNGPYEKSGANSEHGSTAKTELPDQERAANELEGGFQHHQLATKTDWKYPYEAGSKPVSELPDGTGRPGHHFELEGSPVRGPDFNPRPELPVPIPRPLSMTK
ncbi:Glucanosyltransferase-domain-containing protein [Triangularia setosa]|uniref:1,3-beta-glucanosyltransferase n=1 Tax=Triangularia setosa TaxID=2587417 RepID=A0AAN6WBX6_9PEZI|nr:Glucanosyltransferase-domain-containing protein [Podospora setosa]